MKKILILIAFTLFLPFLVFSQLTAIDSCINAGALKQIVEVLASDSLKGRLTGREGATKAANFIADELAKAGTKTLDPYKNYIVSFQSIKISATGYNVIGVLPGTDTTSEAIIFSAHYDHVGTSFTNPYKFLSIGKRSPRNDSIYNGANDNASGVAALICLARYYGQLRNNKRTIIFIAFAGEEFGLVGSSALAATIRDPASISCMINLEMLGRGRSAFITGSELGNLRGLLNNELARIDKKRFKKRFFNMDMYPDQNLFVRSDNFPFAQLGIPAHTIMVTSGNDVYYHSVDDEPSTLDYHLIQRICQAVALAVGPIVDGRVSPARIDASAYSGPTPGF